MKNLNQKIIERIRYLENELYNARRTILILVPDKLQTVVDSYSDCISRQDVSDWLLEVANKVVLFAKIADAGRAECPLCHSFGSNLYSQGYKVPEGLLRHLIGFGRVNQCPVMRHLNGLAREQVDQEARIDLQALKLAVYGT